MAAVAAMGSAIVSMFATRQAREFWAAERESEVYRSVVREPIVGECESFLAETRKILNDVVRKGHALEAHFKNFSQAGLTYRSQVARLREITVVDVAGLPDEVMRETYVVYDDITNLLLGLYGANEANERGMDLYWEEKLARHAGRIGNIVAGCDPAIRQRNLGGHRGATAESVKGSKAV